EARPAPSATTAGFGGGVRVEGEVAPPTDDSRGGRGRKLIYDRRRDAQTMSSTDSRVRGKKKVGKGGKGMPLLAPAAPTKAEKRNIRVEDTISVANLAAAMSVKSTEVIKTLFGLGMMATVNQPLDVDTVELVAAEFGYTVERVGFDLDAYLQKPEDAPGGEVPRSPVVTVMGHVDHGKTSLLDAIRKTHTAAKEAGGITQHIGAYVAEVPGDHFEDGQDRRVVFLDTPGHEAFSAMRARGAKATDVIVLVVAADDGVMPQTVEAINHGKAAKVPMIVAVNKIDKPGADVDRVKRELAENGLVAEDWGGDTIFVDVSAKTGQNLDKLLDMLAVQADVLELTANPDQDARGLVIESRLEKGRGPVATLLVQHGTLKRGQFIVAGSQYCKVRAMLSDLGKPLELAGPSTPVEVIGFDHVTSAGDEFYVVADEKKARAIVEHRIEKQREKDALKTSKRSIEDMFAQTTETAQKELNLIVKADVHGSAEALKESLSKIEHEEVKVRVLHAAVGGVTESDINLAATAKGVIIAFNVKPEAKGKRLADDMGVQIRQYSVIYDAIDDVTRELESRLTPIIEEVVLGHAEIRQIFSVPKLGVIAGCNVTDGVLQRSQQLRVLRGKEVLHEGEFGSLKRFKDDVREVSIGYDCGVGIQNFTKFQVGDVIECYELKKIARKLKPEGTTAHA
ncbi:MAG: translation initiation factor IF-2, partial [Deltaproteobacteria bacterium]|nr:translation initiation factor IF-2 [Deltaproteobacteria bacterium]